MPTSLPQLLHTYQNHILDSTRWRRYRPRHDDIVVATSYKSGTTLTMGIVRQLIFAGRETPPFRELWIDQRFSALDELIDELEAQQHRRYIKTHLSLDGLPYYPQVKYIVVARDPRDVFMSIWNHHRNYTPDFHAFVNALPDRVGDPMPPCPPDLHAFWRDWITRGWFAWESEGYPYWGNLHHTQSWWEYRHLPNILFIHYRDLRADLAGEFQRIAHFLQIEVPADILPALLDAVSLEAMRADSQKNDPGIKEVWVEGANTFYYKGTNGRWKDVLSAEELALYESAAARVLTPECRAWLEQGRVAWQ
jgi:aryl sulfotransferase